MWLNFMTINAMYIYWPVVLVGLTVGILFLPVRILYHRSRKWWAYSNVSNPRSLCFVSPLTIPVASAARRLLSCRVPRFLPGRYVLLPNIRDGRESSRFLYEIICLMLLEH
ncbi:hypothetical protein BO78DRAFT_124714 [Aspergillus sclerotiicarbonarius CBS 121057]|uniref:EXS domain-containing protein n=1 Tax=Aspergillus sclerotiicarbonarius (strain CBS 121057 / IBT 28362) TaxID=1448318 RepID=A0A319EHW4_ASPSB|nr:hypothetical protein BO78DRAFT_124714 [Aspergillus sclerotiicarbonarius CBS 121057]